MPRIEYTDGASLQWNADGQGTYATRKGSIGVRVLGTDGPQQGQRETVIAEVKSPQGVTRVWAIGDSRNVMRTVPTGFNRAQAQLCKGGLRNLRTNGMMRAPFMNRGSRRPIASELLPGPGVSVFFNETVPAPPQSHTQAWSISGQANVPVTMGNPVTLISTSVPLSSHLRISTALFVLAPSTLLEDNYQWVLRVGEMDILNPFNAVAPTGRPMRANIPFQLAPQVEDLPVLAPGTPIKLQVIALANVLDASVVSGSLYGTLWGDI